MLDFYGLIAHSNYEALIVAWFLLLLLLLTYGQRLRLARESRDLSQAELAEMVGVDMGTVGRWERDQMRPSSYHQALIRAKLELSNSEWEFLKTFDYLSANDDDMFTAQYLGGKRKNAYRRHLREAGFDPNEVGYPLQPGRTK